MPDPIRHPARIKGKWPRPLVVEAPRDSLCCSRLTYIPSVDLVVGMRVKIIDIHVRSGRDADLEIGFLLVAERERFVAVAVLCDENGLSDRVAARVQVGRALTEVADGLPGAVAGCWMACWRHEAWEAGA